MPSRKRSIPALAAALFLAAISAGAAIAQNLLERSTEPPRYVEPRGGEWGPPPPRFQRPPSPPPGAIAKPKTPLPAAPGANPTAGAPGATPAATPAGDEPPPPYEPQLLRLSELLGALTYLENLCGSKDGQVWRDKMTALMNAETQNEKRKERLAGAYNRGLKGYELSYRQCTPNAQVIISRFLDESAKIARDVTHRYGTS